MTRNVKIVRTSLYSKALKRLGASEEEVEALEQAIATNPVAGAVVRGLGGVRKLRFSLGGKGKSGRGRAIYFLVAAEGAAVMLTAYPKSEKEDLTSADRKAIRELVKELENE